MLSGVMEESEGKHTALPAVDEWPAAASPQEILDAARRVEECTLAFRRALDLETYGCWHRGRTVASAKKELFDLGNAAFEAIASLTRILDFVEGLDLRSFEAAFDALGDAKVFEPPPWIESGLALDKLEDTRASEWSPKEMAELASSRARLDETVANTFLRLDDFLKHLQQGIKDAKKDADAASQPRADTEPSKPRKRSPLTADALDAAAAALLAANPDLTRADLARRLGKHKQRLYDRKKTPKLNTVEERIVAEREERRRRLADLPHRGSLDERGDEA